jgi:antitoxin ParD1/3/4
MTKSSNLVVKVEPELAELLREVIAAGEFGSEGEAVEAALWSWAGDRMIAALGADQVRQLWREGLASGPGVHPDIESIKAEARRRFEGAKSPE